MDNLFISPTIGMRFIYKNREYEITFLLIDKFRVTTAHGGVNSYWSIDKINSLYNKGDIKIIYENNSILTNPKDINTIKRRLSYVHESLKKGMRCQSKKNLERSIKIISKKINDSNPPSTRTLSKWIRIYRSDSYDIKCLIDNRKGNSTKRKPFYIIEALNHVLKNENNAALINTAKDLESHIYEQLDEKNIIHYENDHYSIRSIQRYMKKFSDPFLQKLRKNGNRYAQLYVRASAMSQISDGLLHVVEIDSHKLDIIALDDETFEVIGRAWITLAIDRFSRVIVGFYISYLPPSAFSSLQTLKDMITRPAKHEMGGIPAAIIPDNGSENINNSFFRLCSSLNITILPAQFRTGNNKPFVENFFKNMTNSLIKKISGTTLSDPDEREEYDSKKYASVTLEQLKNYIPNWINIYHKELHRGINRVSQALWNQEAKKYTPKGITHDEADILCRTLYLRDINNGRVLFEYIYYYSHALKTHELKGVKQAQILVDESDLSYVYVLINNDICIKAESTQKEYTDCLSLSEHKAVREIKSKLNLNDLEEYPEKNNIYARIKLRQLIQSDVELNKSSKKKRNLAKLIKESNIQFNQEEKINIKDSSLKNNEVISFGDFERFGYEELEIDHEV